MDHKLPDDGVFMSSGGIVERSKCEVCKEWHKFNRGGQGQGRVDGSARRQRFGRWKVTFGKEPSLGQVRVVGRAGVGPLLGSMSTTFTCSYGMHDGHSTRKAE